MGPTTGDIEQRAEELAQQLLGTCRTVSEIDETADDELMHREGLAEALDERVLCCHTCGWWCESHEIDDDGNCEDCQDGGSDDD
ncbi:hypothetical protein ELZ19_06895 [Brucella abortus]|uniref:hypothetical protein n=1 Tax=Brucella abortus TaxID=235 RepID=UPI0005C7BAAA|nr:hypothetical protein [Brucella abortus]RUQ67298.1 hypothetical protein ELZ23_15325 [Brucella abortus]RUQ78570.1 hypothetical protein ELZ22_17000 [Brucella abortus]RUQ88312.1 hypothetical protein ELZ18_15755 [Brucella abortus]RUQ90344.1 hypothetical protein ELZ20_15760 [Brucella abortus]RUQ96506.1 hypothetical protein ELZ21_15450 [Brucella abortus]